MLSRVVHVLMEVIKGVNEVTDREDLPYIEPVCVLFPVFVNLGSVLSCLLIMTTPHISIGSRPWLDGTTFLFF